MHAPRCLISLLVVAHLQRLHPTPLQTLPPRTLAPRRQHAQAHYGEVWGLLCAPSTCATQPARILVRLPAMTRRCHTARALLLSNSVCTLAARAPRGGLAQLVAEDGGYDTMDTLALNHLSPAVLAAGMTALAELCANVWPKVAAFWLADYTMQFRIQRPWWLRAAYLNTLLVASAIFLQCVTSACTLLGAVARRRCRQSHNNTGLVELMADDGRASEPFSSAAGVARLYLAWRRQVRSMHVKWYSATPVVV